MRTLRGRIALTLVLFGLTTLVAVGGSLFVGLRNLYREEASARLADTAALFASSARRFGGRGVGNGLADLIVELRELAADSSDDLRIFVVGEDGEATELGTGDEVVLTLDMGDGRTPYRDTGTIDGVGAVAYAIQPIAGERTPEGLRSLVFARPDDSTARALDDLLRALTIAAIVLVLIGVPLALWLSRSVSRPLARLAAATGIVARGDIPVELPVTGPAEVAEATAAFNAMATEVACGRAAQRQLVADLRHDLRTPLTVIGGFAEALRDGTAQGPAIPRAADLIAGEAARMEKMLGDLGALADLERGGRPLEPVPLDAGALMREAAARFGPTASARGQQVTVQSSPVPLPVLADALATDRIISNLVANAMAHTRSHIWLEALPVAPTDPPIGGPGGWSGQPGVVLAVRDDGPGIPAEILPRVFDRFFRGDPSRTGPGAGLGLSIVAELAVAQGGRAFSESRPGNGARVGVVLPAAG